MQKLSALIASARKFCSDHPSIVMGVCTGIGLALTGRTNEAMAAFVGVLVGKINAPLARGVAAACQK